MSYRVVLSPAARTDLFAIYDYIADQSGPERAIAYVDRIEAMCRNLRDFPHRGARRDDIRAGLRILGFERRVTIVFHFEADVVTVDRLLYGGRDVESELR